MFGPVWVGARIGAKDICLTASSSVVKKTKVRKYALFFVMARQAETNKIDKLTYAVERGRRRGDKRERSISMEPGPLSSRPKMYLHVFIFSRL